VYLQEFPVSVRETKYPKPRIGSPDWDFCPGKANLAPEYQQQQQIMKKLFCTRVGIIKLNIIFA
jgi:hypothetical protein